MLAPTSLKINSSFTDVGNELIVVTRQDKKMIWQENTINEEESEDHIHATHVQNLSLSTSCLAPLLTYAECSRST